MNLTNKARQTLAQWPCHEGQPIAWAIHEGTRATCPTGAVWRSDANRLIEAGAASELEGDLEGHVYPAASSGLSALWKAKLTKRASFLGKTATTQLLRQVWSSPALVLYGASDGNKPTRLGLAIAEAETRLTRSEVLNLALEIAGEYRGNLTLRQLYYQFVARGHWGSSDRNYKRLGDILSDARYEGRFPLDWLVDRGREATMGSFTTDDIDVDIAEQEALNDVAAMPVYRPLRAGDHLANLGDLRAPVGTVSVVEHVHWVGKGQLRPGTVRVRTITAPAEVLTIDWALGRWIIQSSVDDTTPTDRTWRAA